MACAEQKPSAVGAKRHHQVFDSLGEFVDYVDTAPSPWKWPQVKKREKREFSGNVTYAETLELVRQGWPEGREKLAHDLHNMQGLATSALVPVQAYDVSGYLPDVPRAVSGMPDCMFTEGEDLRAHCPVVKIVVNISAPCSVDPESLSLKGAAVLSYIDKLEQQGHRCEVAAYLCGNGCKKTNGKSEKLDTRVSFEVVLKRPNDPLDIDRMAFCLVHPAFMRILGLAWYETLPYEEDFSNGYGFPADATNKEKEAMGAAVYIPKTSENFCSPEQALEYVRDQIETQTIKER